MIAELDALLRGLLACDPNDRLPLAQAVERIKHLQSAYQAIVDAADVDEPTLADFESDADLLARNAAYLSVRVYSALQTLRPESSSPRPASPRWSTASPPFSGEQV